MSSMQKRSEELFLQNNQLKETESTTRLSYDKVKLENQNSSLADFFCLEFARIGSNQRTNGNSTQKIKELLRNTKRFVGAKDTIA